MQTVLVTGASGFLGKHIVDQLVKSEKYHVVAVVSGRKSVDFPAGVQCERTNLLKEEERTALIERVHPQILMHLAWAQEDSDFRVSGANMQWLEVSMSLLRHFADNNGKCFFFAGTSDEYSYDNGKAHDVPQRQQMSVYGECKKAFSAIMENYCSRREIRYIDARYFTIYGAGDPHKFGAVPQTIASLLQDKPVICKAPNTIRDYIHVEDAAKASVKIIESDYSGNVNVASGQPRMMRDVFSLIAKILRKEHLLTFENEDRCEQVLVADTSILSNKIGFSVKHDFECELENVIIWWANQDCLRQKETASLLPTTERHGGGVSRILITGASGFIGNAVVEALSQREAYEIYAVTSGRSPVTFPEGIHVVTADLLSERGRENIISEVQPTTILHFAWGLSDKGFLESEDNMLWLEASVSLLRLFHKYGGKEFLFAGSSSEYGYEHEVCKETDAVNPTDMYGICKRAVSAVAKTFCENHTIRFVGMRIFPAYGVGEKNLVHAIPRCMDALAKSQPFVCKGPNNVWDYVYIDDVARAVIKLAESDYNGIVNVASGCGVTMREIFTTIARLLNKEELLSFENEDAVGQKLVADTTVLRNEVNYQCKYDLPSGLEKTMHWWG